MFGLRPAILDRALQGYVLGKAFAQAIDGIS
jgi:hypothetical protein